MKRAKQIIILVVLIAYLVVVYGFINRENEKEVCKSINVSVVDKSENHFIQKNEVISLLNNKGANLIGERVAQINRANLENIIDEYPTIKNSEVYFNKYGILNIDIIQRNPIVRVINKNEESYYIDEEGFLMPLSDKYTARVLIASGNITEPYHNFFKYNIMNQDDSIVKPSLVLRKIYLLAQFITNHKFWNAQIEQIYFNKNKEIELVPRVGAQIILFGDINNYKTKFRKLKAVYEYGFKEKGWNKYRLINLKYKNQVVCTKK
ncbi:MAG: hypothetical protein GXO79_11955 [Chlorobi bacterium]|nr:hypothetical protein [Chlorobiota bacterium]